MLKQILVVFLLFLTLAASFFTGVALGIALISVDPSNDENRNEIVLSETQGELKELREKIDKLAKDVENKVSLKSSINLATKSIKAIIECESRWQIDAVGTAAKIGMDIGAWQINTHFHEEKARNMGLDIHNPADNFRYGLYLLETEGFKPWYASKKCWEKKLKKQGLL